jgi:hypothetical protein
MKYLDAVYIHTVIIYISNTTFSITNINSTVVFNICVCICKILTFCYHLPLSPLLYCLVGHLFCLLFLFLLVLLLNNFIFRFYNLIFKFYHKVLALNFKTVFPKLFLFYLSHYFHYFTIVNQYKESLVVSLLCSFPSFFTVSSVFRYYLKYSSLFLS